MIDDNLLEEKINEIGVLQENLRNLITQANSIKSALESIKLVDGKLPNDKDIGIKITPGWRQKIYDDCIVKADGILSHTFVDE